MFSFYPIYLNRILLLLKQNLGSISFSVPENSCWRNCRSKSWLMSWQPSIILPNCQLCLNQGIAVVLGLFLLLFNIFNNCCFLPLYNIFSRTKSLMLCGLVVRTWILWSSDGISHLSGILPLPQGGLRQATRTPHCLG